MIDSTYAELNVLKFVGPCRLLSSDGDRPTQTLIGGQSDWRRPTLSVPQIRLAGSDEDYNDDALWTDQFARSPDILDFLEKEGLAHYAAGQTAVWDPDEDGELTSSRQENDFLSDDRGRKALFLGRPILTQPVLDKLDELGSQLAEARGELLDAFEKAIQDKLANDAQISTVEAPLDLPRPSEN